MTSVEDFTLLMRGADVALEGRVDQCVQCGRNGIAHDGADGIAYVIHVQVSRVLGDGMLTEPRDYCVLAAASGVGQREAKNGSASATPRAGLASA